MFRLCNREPGNNFRQILTAPLSGRPHLLFDRPSWRSQHIYSLWRPHRHGNFLLPTSNDGFLRATVRSDWMTVVWDWVEMEGKNTGGGNTAVVGVKDKRGSLFLDIYSDIWDLLRLWNIFSEFINWMTTLQHHLSSMNQQAFKAHKSTNPFHSDARARSLYAAAGLCGDPLTFTVREEEMFHFQSVR